MAVGSRGSGRGGAGGGAEREGGWIGSGSGRGGSGALEQEGQSRSTGALDREQDAIGGDSIRFEEGPIVICIHS
jgi:hypothetical protein